MKIIIFYLSYYFLTIYMPDNMNNLLGHGCNPVNISEKLSGIRT